jgi:putative membrane protein
MTQAIRYAAVGLVVGLLTQGARAAAEEKNEAGGFVGAAAQVGAGEIKLSELALKQATNEEVKKYAQRMIKDHTDNNNKLKEIAREQNLTLPEGLNKEHQDTLNRLSGLKGGDFDKEYIKVMLADHQKVVALFENEAKNGKDPKWKAFAEMSLPTLRDHVKHAENVLLKAGL